MEYKYTSWTSTTLTDEIIKDLNEYAKQGWELVSHAQNPYGMSVILKKDSPK